MILVFPRKRKNVGFVVFVCLLVFTKTDIILELEEARV